MLDRPLMLAERGANQTELEGWLAQPPRRLPFDRLPDTWRHLVIETVGRCPEELAPGVVLLNKVRGALGHALLDGASPEARQRLPCPWNPPCALDILFRQRPLPGIKAGAPPPYSLAADVAGRQLRISLRLFGVAAESCAAEIADALVRGLRRGLDLDEARIIPIEVDHREIKQCDAVTRRPPAAERIALQFLTPPAPRSDGSPVGDPAALLRGVYDRVIGMARWLGVSTSDSDDWLESRLRSVRFGAAGLVAGGAHYRRTRNNRDGGYRIPILRGSLSIDGEWRPLWPLLVLGETVHGGRATQGYGRYRLTPGSPREVP